jgi:hypothetical protein
MLVGTNRVQLGPTRVRIPRASGSGRSRRAGARTSAAAVTPRPRSGRWVARSTRRPPIGADDHPRSFLANSRACRARSRSSTARSGNVTACRSSTSASDCCVAARLWASACEMERNRAPSSCSSIELRCSSTALRRVAPRAASCQITSRRYPVDAVSKRHGVPARRDLHAPVHGLDRGPRERGPQGDRSHPVSRLGHVVHPGLQHVRRYAGRRDGGIWVRQPGGAGRSPLSSGMVSCVAGHGCRDGRSPLTRRWRGSGGNEGDERCRGGRGCPAR